jgi:hypothetical protein
MRGRGQFGFAGPEDIERYAKSICEYHNGRLLKVDKENCIVAVEFDSADDALRAANVWPPSDRLEEVPGHPNEVRLSAKSLWADEDEAAQAIEGWGEQAQTAAINAGFLPPKATH